jgi:signal transduction histidine kinase
MRSSALADAIDAHRDEIVASWLDRVKATVDPAGAATTELRNGLPGLLTELVRLLRGANGGASPTQRAAELAADHGTQRFHAGFHIGAVVREYGILRRCLREFIRERAIPVTPEEEDIVGEALHAAIADAVEQYAVERDNRIREQSAAHFSFVAHELRNALASATLTAQALERSGKDPAAALARLRRSLARLRELIDTSLAGARLRELGRTGELRLEEVRLEELVAEATEEVSPRAEDQKITITVTGGAPPVHADRRLIQSAVSNLVRNAVKFTRPGGAIAIRLGAGDGSVSVEVEDECGGLAAEPSDLFLPFVQKGPDRSGFGLGLAITRQAVEAHRGRIQVSNLPGRGCVFMIALPSDARE